ncbi:hypothetical protein FHX37_3489 [Haloactinospora alba]|uniref:Uncharacterized protein n=1 Tax=Haloactinospora alba TaxID=405555 RepID=A0A543NNQ5_9ACTN|nr:hypothetical protein FHX37_3489 [Haloactinospora alba]
MPLSRSHTEVQHRGGVCRPGRVGQQDRVRTEAGRAEVAGGDALCGVGGRRQCDRLAVPHRAQRSELPEALVQQRPYRLGAASHVGVEQSQLSRDDGVEILVHTDERRYLPEPASSGFSGSGSGRGLPERSRQRPTHSCGDPRRESSTAAEPVPLSIQNRMGATRSASFGLKKHKFLREFLSFFEGIHVSRVYSGIGNVAHTVAFPFAWSCFAVRVLGSFLCFCSRGCFGKYDRNATLLQGL